MSKLVWVLLGRKPPKTGFLVTGLRGLQYVCVELKVQRSSMVKTMVSHDTSNVSLGVSNQARHKPACTATETS